MVTKAAAKKMADQSSSARKAGGSDEGEARVVTTDTPEGGPDGPRVETKEAADAEDVEAGIVPNVQAETSHASQAPEDIRDAQVAEPTDKPARRTGAHVESYGAAGVWECSKGDFVSRQSAEAVEEHIASHHK